jgi:site-specific recombinase XerD
MHIEEYIAQLKETCGSDIINARLSAIISFFAFLIENDIIDKNPCSKVKKIKKEKEESVVYLSKPEIKRIKKYLLEGNKKNNFAKRDYCLFALGVRLGLRISAILNIDIDDIDFTNKTITVIEKGNITKNVVFGEDTAEIIKMWLKARSNIINDDNKALFISAKRNRMSVRAAERVIEDCGNYIGKHISPHKLRSTCAMNLYNKTGDIYLVQQQLGHKNIQNTMIYAKASDERKREAANILDNL